MYTEHPHRSARDEMLRQLSERGVHSARVLAAIAHVPRERFVPPDVQHMAYADRALPIACEQTISQPYIVALMTEALELAGGERVLEIGTGSGYQTAILAELASGVVSVERHAELSRDAKAVLDELGVEYDPRGNVKTDARMMTSLDGVFACGDMQRGQSLVVWAIAEGRAAARGVDEWLMGTSELPGVKRYFRNLVLTAGA